MNDLASIGLIAALYYASAKLGLSAGFLKGNVTAVWPPSGFALAVLVLYGSRRWPGVALGALLVNGLSPVPFAAACRMAAGNTLEALVGAYLLRRFARSRPSLSKVRDVLVLAALAAGLSTLVSAAIGVTSLWAVGVVPGHAVWTTARVWWVGDGLGDLVVAPALLVALGTPRVRRSVARNYEGVVLLIAVPATTYSAFHGASIRPYLILPLVAWAAIRFGPRGAATSVLVVSGIAIVATAGGRGPFTAATSTDALWILDTFLAVVALTALILAAVVSERNDVQDELRAANRDLEDKVRSRTAELDRDRERFHLLVDGVHDYAIYMLDPEGRVVSWNAGAERIEGYAEEGIVGHSFARFYLPEDLEAGQPGEALRIACSQGRFEEEAPRVRADGSRFWASVIITSLVKDGEVLGFATVTKDVTACREADEALRRSQAELAEAQAIAHIGSFRFDVAANSITWSDELFRIYGLDPGSFEATFEAFIERIHVDDRARVQATIGAALRHGDSFLLEERIVRPDGEIRVLASSGQVVTDENGRPTHMVGVCQDVTDDKAAEEALTHQAAHDALTDLPNRTLLLDRLTQALARRATRPCSTAVFFLDIDRFKWLNDSLGHAAGDQLLIEVGRRLQAGIRPHDTVARLGGDEFVIMCEDLDRDEATIMAQRLAALVEPPVTLDGCEVTPGVSIGIAISEAAADGDETADSLLRDADAAMYQAKDRGRARFEMFDSGMRAGVQARLETQNALRRALERNEIVVHFQPVVDLTTGHATGVEALARWAHPTRGLLLPGEFIALAEETGLIVPLGASVLASACAQVARWRGRYPELATLEVSVNLSARQLLDPRLIDVVRDTLMVTGLPAGALCLEITESVFLEDGESAAAALRALKSLGVCIGVDDFGTGFSSLTYLKRFPVDVLKIDRSFVAGLGRSREDRAIVSGIIDLAHAFGIRTIAEGVETATQLKELEALGCEQAQGYLWSRPVADTDALPCLRSMTATSGGGQTRTDAPLRVLVVDDDKSMRGLLSAIFRAEEGFDLVGEASDGREAVAIARRHQPDVVLLDLAMPGIGGLEALPLLRAVAPGTKVVVLSGLEAGDVENRAHAAGAAAYLTKGADPNLLPERLVVLLAP